MTKHVSHSPEVRAAVIAALLAGQSVSQTAREYKISKGTVSAWKRRTAPQIRKKGAKVAPVAGVAAEVAASATEKAEDVEALLVALVVAKLKGLIELAAVMQDVRWIRNQNAADLAVLGGVEFDKTARMLEAMGKR